MSPAEGGRGGSPRRFGVTEPPEAARPPFGGLWLAMDTSGAVGSAALAAPVAGSGEVVRLEVLARVSLLPEEEHAALLVPRVEELMEEVGADREELAAIVVGSGPGSFTGVRVGAATAKAMAWSLRVPLYAVSSLAAAALAPEAEPGGRSTLADPFSEPVRPRCVLFDARGDRVYAAAYRAAHGCLETLLEPVATTVTEMMDGLIPCGSVLMGGGALRHGDLLTGAGYTILPAPAGRPGADGLLRRMELQPHPRALDDPGRWEPAYLRASGAELMWKTRKGGDA